MTRPTHPARMLPGGPVAAAVFADVTTRAEALRRTGVVPSLATILVGDDPASAGYIRMKQQRAADLDGLHPLSLGRLAAGLPGPVPCTPAGIEALLAFHDIPVAGRDVVILGRGTTLGRRLLPDLDEACAAVAGAITPRVGGVGPTTVAMLFRNAVELAERHAARSLAT